MKSDPESPGNNLDSSSSGFPEVEIVESERSNQNKLKNNVGEAKMYDIQFLPNQPESGSKQAGKQRIRYNNLDMEDTKGVLYEEYSEERGSTAHATIARLNPNTGKYILQKVSFLQVLSYLSDKWENRVNLEENAKKEGNCITRGNNFFLKSFINLELKSKHSSSLCNCSWIFCKKPKLKAQLAEELNSLQSISAIKYNDKDNMHRSMLLTLFRRLTRGLEQYNEIVEKMSVPIGSRNIHKLDRTYNSDECNKYEEFVTIDWRIIGFQTENNPGTDIRGSNMLGILNLLFLCENYSSLANNLYVLSHSNNHFPLILVALDISKIVLKCIRSGNLNRVMNKYENVLEICHLFYVGVFCEWLKRYARLSLGIIGYRKAFDQTLPFVSNNAQKLIMNVINMKYEYLTLQQAKH